MKDAIRIPWFHFLANIAMYVAMRVTLDLDLQGIAYAPRTGPLLIVTNHTSFLDPLIPGVFVRRDVLPMAKEELFQTRWRPLFVGYGAFPVRRGQADLTALKNALRVLQSGHALLMAPEGTRARTGGLQQAHLGAALIAVRSGAPILPIAQWGGTAFFENLRRLRRTRVHLRVAPPMVVRPLERKPTREDLTAITDEIMYTLATMLPPAYRGLYANVAKFAPRYLVPYHRDTQTLFKPNELPMSLAAGQDG